MRGHRGVQYAALHIGLHRQHVVAGALPVRKQFENLPLKLAPHNKLNPKSALYLFSSLLQQHRY